MFKLTILTVVFMGSIFGTGYNLASHLEVFSVLSAPADPVDAASLNIGFSDGAAVAPNYQLQPSVNVLK